MTQEEALRVLKTGANVFLTGEPGSGKTYTINQYIRYLRAHGIEPAITASTGIAATHVGGMTIHSWSGIGVRDYLTEYDVEAISENKNVRRRIKDTHVLVIDEVSMLAGNVLLMVDQVLRAVKEVATPFGGIQVVLVGDFFQLPPVVRSSRAGWGQESEDGSSSPFAFNSPAWGELNPLVCYLEEQYRQDDTSFAKLLGSIRAGDALEGVHHILEARTVREHEAPKDAPRLFSHNSDVDRINEERLHQVPGRMHTFTMTARGGEMLVASLKRGCLSPEHLLLKEGARVMFTKNDPAGRFVNGTLGLVTAISMGGATEVRTHDGRRIDVEQSEWTMEEGGRVLARIAQLPLRLAWAITVHKSQGMTLDEAVVDLTKAFEFGQGYVALSRVRTLAGLHVVGYNRRALEVHPEVRARDQYFKGYSADTSERFGSMSTNEHAAYATRFIVAAGGSQEGGAPVTNKKKRAVEKGASHAVTLEMLKRRTSIKDIAKARGLKEGTIIDHVADLYMRDHISRDEVRHAVPPALLRALPKIDAAFKRHGTEKLTPIFNELKGVYSFDELKLARLLFDVR